MFNHGWGPGSEPTLTCANVMSNPPPPNFSSLDSLMLSMDKAQLRPVIGAPDSVNTINEFTHYLWDHRNDYEASTYGAISFTDIRLMNKTTLGYNTNVGYPTANNTAFSFWTSMSGNAVGLDFQMTVPPLNVDFTQQGWPESWEETMISYLVYGNATAVHAGPIYAAAVAGTVTYMNM